MEATIERLTQTLETNPNTSQTQFNVNFDTSTDFAGSVQSMRSDSGLVTVSSAEGQPASPTRISNRKRRRMGTVASDALLSTEETAAFGDIVSAEENLDARADITSRRNQLTRRRKFFGALGMSVGLLGSGLGLAACDPVTECALNGTATARACWDANTGVERLDGVRERWQEEEILSGTADGQLTRMDDWEVTLGDNAVLENVYLTNGCVKVVGKNVKIDNAYIRSDHVCGGGINGNAVGAIISTGGTEGEPAPSPVSVTITDTEISGMGSTEDHAGVAQMWWTGYNLNIHDVVKGVRMDEGVNLYESYIHDLVFSVEHHGEAIYWNGGFGPNNVSHNWAEAKQSTGAFVLHNTTWASGNAVIENNYFGGNGGASFIGGANFAGNAAFATGIVVRNNAIDTNGSDPDARAFCNTCPGNEWTGNYYVTGATIGGEVPVPTPGRY